MIIRSNIIRMIGLSMVALSGGIAQAVIPSTELYPFPGYDLGAVRAKTKAEWIANSKELNEAWHLYGELQGSWSPGMPKPQEQTVAQLNQLKAKLEALPKPPWFSDALDPAQAVQTKLADEVGDQTFVKQRSSPEYQALKALTIIYLTEHELDREGSAQKANQYLVALTITHPWDWELHGLHSRFFIDARNNGPAWEEAKLSVFLNPQPSLGQLKSFAFVGSIAANEKWPEIQRAMRQAVTDDRIAELAIVESEGIFSRDAKVNVVVPKGR
jgi:hypothetical protein